MESHWLFGWLSDKNKAETTENKGKSESEASEKASGMPDPQAPQVVAAPASKTVAAAEPSKLPATSEVSPEDGTVSAQPSVTIAAAAPASGPTPPTLSTIHTPASQTGNATPLQVSVDAGSGGSSSVSSKQASTISSQKVTANVALKDTVADSQQATNTTVRPPPGVPSATKAISFQLVGMSVSESNKTATTGPQNIPPTKKRKLKPLPVTQLLSDHPIIQKTVHNLLGLLQTYGPLTVGQLEYNLPPISGERVNSQTIHDIVQVLVCTGLVQRVCDPPANAGQSDKPPSYPRFCINGGVPRADVVLPHKVLEQISAAHDEIKRCAERRRRLKEALSSKGSPKEMLKEIAIEFPEVVQDPVYVTALRSFHIDITAVEKERHGRHQQAIRRSAASRAATAASSTTASALQLKSSTTPAVSLSAPVSSKAPEEPDN